MDLKTYLTNQINQKGFLIVSHRGEWGGNIIQNTIQSTALASRLGADIVEIDLCRTVDGEYYLFHEGHEKDLLHEERKFSEITSKEIEEMPVYNSIASKSGYRINRLDDFLSWLPDDLIINIDRAYFYFDEPHLFSLLRESGKTHQFFLKAPVTKEYLTQFSQNGEGLNFIPIVAIPSEVKVYEQYAGRIQTIGYEIVFRSEDELAKYTDLLKDYPLRMANAIHLGMPHILAGGRTDDGALFQKGKDWEDILSAGFTAIQTDWPALLNNYREEQWQDVE